MSTATIAADSGAKTRIESDDTPVRQFTIAAIFWGIIGMLVGVLIATQLGVWQANFGVRCSGRGLDARGRDLSRHYPASARHHDLRRVALHRDRRRRSRGQRPQPRGGLRQGTRWGGGDRSQRGSEVSVRTGRQARGSVWTRALRIPDRTPSATRSTTPSRSPTPVRSR